MSSSLTSPHTPYFLLSLFPFSKLFIGGRHLTCKSPVAAAMFGKVVMGAQRVKMFMSVGTWSWECMCVCSFLCTWQARAFVSVVSSLMACSPIEALRWCAWLRKHLACAPAVAWKTLAAKWAMCVHTAASIQTLSWLAAFVYVVATVLALEAGWTRTVVVVVPVGAAGTISTWACGAGIDQRAVLTYTDRERELIKWMNEVKRHSGEQVSVGANLGSIPGLGMKPFCVHALAVYAWVWSKARMLGWLMSQNWLQKWERVRIVARLYVALWQTGNLSQVYSASHPMTARIGTPMGDGEIL